jgi:beta-1,2-mannobiose phosphorylase / 1,2-beta-oligomannan phosphorylase
MIKLQRLGVVLTPPSPTPRTVAKFNAGMARDGDIVHMAFRYAEWRENFDPQTQSNYAKDEVRYARLSASKIACMGKGEAASPVLYEATTPLIAPSLPWDVSGCQDARIVPFEGAYYLCYTGWDKDTAPAGKDTARVGVARTHDFQTAEKLGFVSHFTWDKDAYIFPERIGGKVAFVHRVEPNIQIDYFDSLEAMLDPRAWAGYRSRVEASTVLQAEYPWECGKVGGSVPPVKTPSGWLMIYHAVQTFPDRLFIYRAGAALLDLENPSRVVARLPYPILEPEEDYELHGDVDNVVFPAGGYAYEGDLYISYGGADRVVALAKLNLEELIEEMIR